MKNQPILVISIVVMFICLSSCDGKKKTATKTQSDFSFYIPEADVYITTSKRVDAQFFVLFSRKPGIAALSDSVSYIKCETMDADIIVIFNPKEKKDIYVTYPAVQTIHQTDFNIHRMSDDQYDTLFHEKQIGSNPLILKEPFIELLILPETYTIVLQCDSSFEKQIRIKEGDMFGGW